MPLGISWDISWADIGCLRGCIGVSWRSWGGLGRLGCFGGGGLWRPLGIHLGPSRGLLGALAGSYWGLPGALPWPQ
eukprot:5832705-Pyramimonas_sp.AAC.1